MSRFLLLACCIVCFASCRNNNDMPSDVLNKQKMQAVLWDMLRIEAYTENFLKTDTLKNLQNENLQLQQKVFAIHHITKEAFYKSYDYYKQHPALLSEVLDSITTKEAVNREHKINKPLYKPEIKKSPLLSKPK
ncbi:DUF4296 domain-containing protein [Ferruginibacter albus]|uniref:DUF4296 domain-containing protein n=1 Tax=Ferruginibacter albus TaxID=2875540 RepID=UPI001CC4F33D|nr:DUF4296 domain-containing protein [Ferruginibacter albus]UAY52670.1 DUF4296 domain-containing protein [Ferruginibacter albus]